MSDKISQAEARIDLGRLLGSYSALSLACGRMRCSQTGRRADRQTDRHLGRQRRKSEERRKKATKGADGKNVKHSTPMSDDDDEVVDGSDELFLRDYR